MRNSRTHTHSGSIASERRAALRLLCSDLVSIAWNSSDGTPHQEIAVLENVSAAGVGLFLGMPVTPETTIRLALEEEELTGTVNQCVSWQNGYIVGLRLDSQSEGRLPTMNRPRHLLDPTLLDFE